MTVQVGDYDDDEMIRGMADENYGKAESIAAKLDVIRLARKRLIEDPTRCKAMALSARPSKFTSVGCSRGEHGGSACISAYLSTNGKIWSERSIREYTQP
jgi:hypothetical protein